MELLDDFDTLELLVYEVGLSKMSLKELQDLEDLEKLKLLMSTVYFFELILVQFLKQFWFSDHC